MWTDIRICWQILVQVSNTKSRSNPSCESYPVSRRTLRITPTIIQLWHTYIINYLEISSNKTPYAWTNTDHHQTVEHNQITNLYNPWQCHLSKREQLPDHKMYCEDIIFLCKYIFFQSENRLWSRVEMLITQQKSWINNFWFPEYRCEHRKCPHNEANHITYVLKYIEAMFFFSYPYKWSQIGIWNLHGFATFKIKVSMLPWQKRACMLNRWNVFEGGLTCSAFLGSLMLTAMCEMENNHVAYFGTTYCNIRNW